jgi:hypothetical protein
MWRSWYLLGLDTRTKFQVKGQVLNGMIMIPTSSDEQSRLSLLLLSNPLITYYSVHARRVFETEAWCFPFGLSRPAKGQESSS